MILMRNGINGDEIERIDDVMTETAMDSVAIPIIQEVMSEANVPEDGYLVTFTDEDSTIVYYKIGNEELLDDPECDFNQWLTVFMPCKYHIYVKPEYFLRYLDAMNDYFS